MLISKILTFLPCMHVYMKTKTRAIKQPGSKQNAGKYIRKEIGSTFQTSRERKIPDTLLGICFTTRLIGSSNLSGNRRQR